MCLIFFIFYLYVIYVIIYNFNYGIGVKFFIYKYLVKFKIDLKKNFY